MPSSSTLAALLRPPLARQGYAPGSYAEFRVAELAHQPGLRRHCRACGQRFSLCNTHCAQAWCRTQTHALCEDCYNLQKENHHE